MLPRRILCRQSNRERGKQHGGKRNRSERCRRCVRAKVRFYAPASGRLERITGSIDDNRLRFRSGTDDNLKAVSRRFQLRHEAGWDDDAQEKRQHREPRRNVLGETCDLFQARAHSLSVARRIRPVFASRTRGLRGLDPKSEPSEAANRTLDSLYFQEYPKDDCDMILQPLIQMLEASLRYRAVFSLCALLLPLP
jgi:hypothetical protein